MPFWQLFYHLVWSTKNREPLLTPDIESIVYGHIRSKAIGLGATFFALNGNSDHVHMVVAIPPAIAVARFVGQIKGVSAAQANKGGCAAVVQWQREYGAFSFDAKRLPNFVAYVEHQKEHHAQAKLIPALERTSEGAVSLIRDAAPSYAVSTQAWWDELLSAWSVGPSSQTARRSIAGLPNSAR